MFYVPLECFAHIKTLSLNCSKAWTSAFGFCVWSNFPTTSFIRSHLRVALLLASADLEGGGGSGPPPPGICGVAKKQCKLMKNLLLTPPPPRGICGLEKKIQVMTPPLYL